MYSNISFFLLWGAQALWSLLPSVSNTFGFQCPSIALNVQHTLYLNCILIHRENASVATASWNLRKSWGCGYLFVHVNHCGQIPLFCSTNHHSFHPVDKSLLSLANTAHLIASSGSEASNTSVSRFSFLCYLLT